MSKDATVAKVPEKVTKPKKEKVINEQAKPNIYQKIFNVQQGVQTVLKGGKNTHHGYSYAREIDMIGEIKPLLAKERLVVLASTEAFTKTEKLSQIRIKFTIVNIDKPEEKVEEDFVGEGEDKSGSIVGTPIAYTMALKYFLAKTFLVETGDDAEIADKKGKKGGVEETAEVKFEKAKKMIAGTNNVSGLIEYEEKMKEGKSFNKTQKEELSKLIRSRVDEIDSKQG